MSKYAMPTDSSHEELIALKDLIRKWIPIMQSAIRLLEEEGYNRATLDPKRNMLAAMKRIVEI